MTYSEIVKSVKEAIISEIQSNPIIIRYVKEISIFKSNIHMHYENGVAGEIFNIIVVDRISGNYYKVRNLFTNADYENLSMIIEMTFKQFYKILETIKSDPHTSDSQTDPSLWDEYNPINKDDISNINSKMELIYKL